jgi:hypothetical protein
VPQSHFLMLSVSSAGELSDIVQPLHTASVQDIRATGYEHDGLIVCTWLASDMQGSSAACALHFVSFPLRTPVHLMSLDPSLEIESASVCMARGLLAYTALRHGAEGDLSFTGSREICLFDFLQRLVLWKARLQTSTVQTISFVNDELGLSRCYFLLFTRVYSDGSDGPVRIELGRTRSNQPRLLLEPAAGWCHWDCEHRKLFVLSLVDNESSTAILRCYNLGDPRNVVEEIQHLRDSRIRVRLACVGASNEETTPRPKRAEPVFLRSSAGYSCLCTYDYNLESSPPSVLVVINALHSKCSTEFEIHIPGSTSLLPPLYFIIEGKFLLIVLGMHTVQVVNVATLPAPTRVFGVDLPCVGLTDQPRRICSAADDGAELFLQSTATLWYIKLNAESVLQMLRTDDRVRCKQSVGALHLLGAHERFSSAVLTNAVLWLVSHAPRHIGDDFIDELIVIGSLRKLTETAMPGVLLALLPCTTLSPLPWAGLEIVKATADTTRGATPALFQRLKRETDRLLTLLGARWGSDSGAPVIDGRAGSFATERELAEYFERCCGAAPSTCAQWAAAVFARKLDLVKMLSVTFFSVKDMHVQFELLQKLHVVLDRHKLTPPKGFRKQFSRLALQILPRTILCQYIDRGMLQLSEQQIRELLSKLGSSEADRDFAFWLASRVPSSEEALALMAQQPSLARQVCTLHMLRAPRVKAAPAGNDMYEGIDVASEDLFSLSAHMLDRANRNSAVQSRSQSQRSHVSRHSPPSPLAATREQHSSYPRCAPGYLESLAYQQSPEYQEHEF